jgi:tetratricopeptide (TPR) repeat protein
LKRALQADPLLAQAVALHQAGRLAEAEPLFRSVLELAPRQLDALNLLGIGRVLRGDPAEGLRLLGRSLRLRPQQPHALNFQGYALHAAGQYAEALAAYNRAVALLPDFTDAWCNRGLTLQQLGRAQDALASFERAAALNPGLAQAHQRRAALLQDLGRGEEAVAAYRRLLQLEPRNAQAHSDLGTALAELERGEEALESIDRALVIDPGLFGALVNRGNVLNQLRRGGEALRAYDRALAADPAVAELHSNRGHLLHDAGRYDEALQAYDRALALDPGLALVEWNKSLIKLLHGEFEEGWRLYESRWQSYARTAFRDFPQPLWLGGEPLAGRTILLHAEQGLGDTLQFCRYVPLVAALGAAVVLEAPAALLPLLASLAGCATLVASGEPLPPFQLQCPLLSLPLAFGTRVETIPAQLPYLAVPPARQEQWDTRLGPRRRRRVGLAWSGAAAHLADRERSLPLRLLAPLLGLDAEFHCLQKEVRPADEPALAQLPQLTRHEHELHDFADTAALAAAMDLVIAVDTSVAHLAGALGRPLWVLLQHAPDFRWMLRRADTPWYPDTRLFRQEQPGGWEAVIERVAAQLAATLPA